jgi:pyridoxal phosphate enzyme (YggS family)
MTPSSITARLAAVRSQLPASVTLVAVSKTHPPEAIREAYAAGQRHFGENYAQEWRAKADALADLPELVWHFVGGLQTNKVKVLAPRAAWVHTLDREELARELSRRYAALGATVRVLIEVNLGGEQQKSGCAPDRVEPLVALAQQLPGLEVAGLMCIPPPQDEPRPHFNRLRSLRDGLGLRELSMGMSADWPIAVEEGATLIRLGTALFGERGL